jgi:hypothetical protein
MLALGILVMMLGLIAGSVITKPAIQHHNIGAQTSAAYCGYKNGWFSDWWGWGRCTYDIWVPDLTLTFGGAVAVAERVTALGERTGGWRLIRTGLRLLRFTGWGL